MKVLIPFKEHSVRCPNKNFILFPYVFDQLKAAGIGTDEIVAISKSDRVKKFVEGLGCQFMAESPLSTSDTHACYYAAKELGLDKYVELPLT